MAPFAFFDEVHKRFDGKEILRGLTLVVRKGEALVILGGSGTDYGEDIAVDNDGTAYLTGFTSPPADFPMVNPLQPAHGGGNADAFLTKVNAAGSALVYSTYLGGSMVDFGVGITLDSDGNAYAIGYTESPDFRTENPAQAASGGAGDAFVTKVSATGDAFLYSTFLGGTGMDGMEYVPHIDMVADAEGNIYVAGITNSTDFPTTPGAYQSAVIGDYDIFIVKFDPHLRTLMASTLLGGDSAEGMPRICLGTGGNIYITGTTSSTDFPMTLGAIDPDLSGDGDIFVAKLNEHAIASAVLALSITTAGKVNEKKNHITPTTIG